MIGVALIFIMPINSTYDFDGIFSVDLPSGRNYWNVAWCHDNGALGCKNEYWDKDAGCEINGDEVVVYYYNNSLIDETESNAYQHAINVLTKTYLYYVYQNDGNSIILKNDLGMNAVPPYLVGKVSEDGNEVVFVGGHQLDDLKKYADSVEFK